MCTCMISDSSGLIQKHEIYLNGPTAILTLKKQLIDLGVISNIHEAVINYEKVDEGFIVNNNHQIAFILPVKMTGTEWRLSRTNKKKKKNDNDLIN
jgi:hypothetical protein